MGYTHWYSYLPHTYFYRLYADLVTHQQDKWKRKLRHNESIHITGAYHKQERSVKAQQLQQNFIRKWQKNTARIQQLTANTISHVLVRYFITHSYLIHLEASECDKKLQTTLQVTLLIIQTANQSSSVVSRSDFISIPNLSQSLITDLFTHLNNSNDYTTAYSFPGEFFCSTIPIHWIPVHIIYEPASQQFNEFNKRSSYWKKTFLITNKAFSCLAVTREELLQNYNCYIANVQAAYQ